SGNRSESRRDSKWRTRDKGWRTGCPHSGRPGPAELSRLPRRRGRRCPDWRLRRGWLDATREAGGASDGRPRQAKLRRKRRSRREATVPIGTKFTVRTKLAGGRVVAACLTSFIVTFLPLRLLVKAASDGAFCFRLRELRSCLGIFVSFSPGSRIGPEIE